MRAFLALLGVSFKGLLLSTFSFGNKKKRAVSGVGAFIFLALLMLVISASYSFGIAHAGSIMGFPELVLLTMAMMAVFFPFVFIIFASQSLVFSNKDADLVLSLPVPAFAVMLARVMALYLEALVMCELLLLPAGVAYLVFGGGGGAGLILLMLLIGAFMALLPTTLALLFGALVALVVSRLRYKNLISVIFSLLLVVVVMVASFGLSFSANSLEAGNFDISGLKNTLTGIFPPLWWAVQGMLGQVLPALGFIALCVVPFLAVTWLLSRFYKGMLTRLGSHAVRSDYKMGRMSASGVFAALVRKEARRFFGTPSYFMNAGIGYLMVLLAAVAAVVARGQVAEVITGLAAQMGGGFVADYLPLAVLAILVFFCGMVNTTSVSISLEGKTLWVLKSSPVSPRQVFGAKCFMGVLLPAVTIVVAVPLLAFGLALPPAEAAVIAAVLLLLSVTTALLGLMVNLMMPKLDADNDTLVVKQSASVMMAMLGNFVLMGLCAGLYVLCRGLGFVAFCGLCCLLLAALSGLLALALATKGQKLYAAL